MFVSRLIISSPTSRSGCALRDGGVHLLNRYALPALAVEQAVQFLHRPSGGHDVEFSFSHFDEFNAISSVNPQRGADLYRNGDLPFGGYGRGCHERPFPDRDSLHCSKEPEAWSIPTPRRIRSHILPLRLADSLVALKRLFLIFQAQNRPHRTPTERVRQHLRSVLQNKPR